MSKKNQKKKKKKKKKQKIEIRIEDWQNNIQWHIYLSNQKS